MTFRNPILGAGGSTLLRPAIQSPNYVPGQAGWKVGRDGNVEFNTGTFRNGEFVSGTELYYSGTPAAGNLIASVSDSQGTDTYGNTYFAGVCTYDNSSGGFTQLLGVDFFSGRKGDAIANVAALGYATLSTTERGTLPAALLRAPTNGSHTYRGAVIATPGDDSTEANAPRVYVVEQNGGATVYGGISGAWVKTDNAGNALTKQAPALGSGWAAGPVGGAYRALQFWKDAEDNLIISGVCHSTSATPSAVVFTLPTGYIPKSGERPGIDSNQGGTYAPRSIEINASTGAVTVDPVPTAANTDLYIYVSVPMGNTA